VKYLSAEQVLFIHSRLIDRTGGRHGIRDLGLLQSAVARPAASFGGEDLYPDIFHKAASFLESLIRNHPFVDGNKRTAITAAALMLEQNGCRFRASPEELERFTIRMAAGKETLIKAVQWLKRNVTMK
jgi:death-on-curing protein